MKIKKLLPLTLAAAFMMTGCTPKPSKPDADPDASKKHTVEISNAADITAEWRVGDASRTLTVAITQDGVAGNATLAMTKKKLEIMSSDAAVLKADGFTVSAISAGTAKLTVKYYEAVKELNITIGEKLTNKAKYGTAHEGTEDDPFDNEDAVKVGKWCKDNGNTTEELVVRGEVASFYHAPGSRDDGAVSWFLKPAAGQTEKFEVYKCYKDAKGTVALTDDDIWVGAVVTAKGIFTYYADGNQAETTSGTWIKTEGTKPEAPKTIDATVAEAIAVGTAMEDGASSWDYYKITAYVVKKDNDKQYWIADSKTEENTANMIELYGISDTEMQGKLLKQAKVEITMRLKRYHSTIENSGAPTALTVLEAGGAWTVSYIEVNCAGAITAAKALADGETSSEAYKVTGKVVKVTSAWQAKYGNITFTMADTTDAEETLTVFRLECTAEEAATIVAGADIVVTGNLQNYVKNEAHTYEVVNAKLFK